MTALLYGIAAAGVIGASLQWPKGAHRTVQALLSIYILAAILIFTREPTTVTIGSTIFGACLAATSIYPLLIPNASTTRKLIILFMAVSTLVTFVFALLRFPGTGILSLLCGVNVVLYLIVQLKWRKDFKLELAILTMVTAESLIRFVISAVRFL